MFCAMNDFVSKIMVLFHIAKCKEKSVCSKSKDLLYQLALAILKFILLWI